MQEQIKRGEVYFADLKSGVVGSEQGGTRPVIIVSNDVGNTHSGTVIVIPLTSQTKRKLPTHFALVEDWLPYSSTALCEQVRTIDKSRLKEQLGKLPEHQLTEVYKVLMVALGVLS